MRADTDDALIASARAGSRTARAELFRRHWRGAWTKAFAMTGRRALADDIVQDAFERAFRALDSYEPHAPFERWLSRIVSNRAIDLLRRERREASLDEAPDPVMEWTGGHEADDTIRRAVARLDPDRRVAVVLRYWLDRSPTEIAEITGVSVGTVHSRLARALIDLRVAVPEHPDA